MKHHSSEEIKVVDLVLNSNFRRHNLEIFNQLSEKIIKAAAWIERPSLVQYTLGVVTILALNRCEFDSLEITKLMMNNCAISREEMVENCEKVLQSSGCEQYTLTSY